MLHFGISSKLRAKDQTQAIIIAFKRGLPIGQRRSHHTIVMLEARQDESVASKYMGFDG
jgi:hypothetical protein